MGPRTTMGPDPKFLSLFPLFISHLFLFSEHPSSSRNQFSFFSFLPVSLSTNVPNEVNRTLSLANMPEDAGVLIRSTEEAGVSSDTRARETAEPSSRWLNPPRGSRCTKWPGAREGQALRGKARLLPPRYLVFLCFKIDSVYVHTHMCMRQTQRDFYLLTFVVRDREGSTHRDQTSSDFLPLCYQQMMALG